MNPLQQNKYAVKDSLDVANKINQILPDVHNSDEYVLVSLEVVSLFTNVPLNKTDIILKRIYTDKEIINTLTKRSLKKLILVTCQKMLFLMVTQMVLVWENY